MPAGNIFSPGDTVTDGRGAIGIVTEPARKAGVYKGRVSVMWAGGRYTVTEWPEDLQPVTVFAYDPATSPEGGAS